MGCLNTSSLCNTLEVTDSVQMDMYVVQQYSHPPGQYDVVPKSCATALFPKWLNYGGPVVGSFPGPLYAVFNIIVPGGMRMEVDKNFAVK